MSTKEVEWDGIPVPRRYWAILAIAMGITVSVLDGTIANVALPSIAGDLDATPSMSIWIVNAYQLAIVVSLLSLSSLGDIWGYKRVYIAGLLIFSVTSLACALSTSLTQLTVARVFQGFGAAALASVNTTLIRIIYPRRFLGRGLGINALVVAVSAAGGPTIAAGILSIASWPWLFAINVPIVIVALILSCKFLPSNPVKDSGRTFDWKSGIMNALTFGLLIFSIEGFTHDMNWKVLLPMIAAVFVIGYFFVRRQLSQTYPLLPVDLLRIPIFSLSVGTSICSFVAQMLAMVSLPFFLQHTLGKSEVATGILLTPWPLATMIAAPLAGKLIERVHAGLLGGIGLSIFAGGLFLLAVLADKVSGVEIALFMVMCGFGFGLFQTPNNSILISSAPQNRSGSASGMLGMSRLTGQTTGASLVALMFVMFPVNGTYASLYLAGIFAFVAAVVSFTRVSLPEPELLRGNAKKKS
ncbi:MFS transporter [Butyricimonas sp.]|uniref:MFS transporter n=1 Tax=Butyricimonas sp. TaxID=1969738 RepID=UPI0025C1914B|nr:MFS transporter [Butyricimonas sp.]